MAVYIVPAPTRKELRMFPLFNATTSDINFGLAPSMNLAQQSSLVYCNMAGAGEQGGIIGKFWHQGPATNQGPRFFTADVSGVRGFGFYAGSSGSAFQPGIASSTSVSSYDYNTPLHLAFTWPFTNPATDIKLYVGANGAPLTEAAYTTGNDGIGSPLTGSGFDFHIGNFSAGTDTFNGTIYYVARWNRVLPLWELRRAQIWGPLSVPDGLVLCWANNQDYSPTRLMASSQTAVVMTGPAPPNPLLEWDWRDPALWPMFSISTPTRFFLLGRH